MEIQHEKGGFTMRPRTLLLLALAAMVGATVAVLPALAAAPSESKLEVNENCVEPDWPCWATPGSSQPAAKVTIASGGSVTFADSKTAANIAWTGPAPTCESAVPVAPASSKTGWEGKCTFATPGTYKFESSTLWPEYTKYEVVVEGASPAPPTPTTSEGGSTGGSTTGTTSGPSPAGESQTGSPLSGAPKISSSQRGSTVKGSIEVSKAGAGDRLEVNLIATAASLAKARHATQVVGRFVSASVGVGHRSFSVKLDTKARQALKRRHHLALKVEITLAPANGEATSVTRSMTLHAS
jgi:plastocyanin